MNSIPAPFFRKIDHIGIAVRDLASAQARYALLLGVDAFAVKEVPDQKVKTAFFEVGESHIELLEPTDETSTIAKFLEKRGEGMHHICVEVSDIEGLLKYFADSGVQLIDKVPRIGAMGQKVAFVHPKAAQGVLLELSEPQRD